MHCTPENCCNFNNLNDSNYCIIADNNHHQVHILQSKYPDYKFVYKDPEVKSNDKKLDNSWVIDLR
jgi:hypothetical protein